MAATRVGDRRRGAERRGSTGAQRRSSNHEAGDPAEPNERPATRRELDVVAEQRALLERVRQALGRAATRPARGRAGGGGEFETLREELFEARDDDVALVLALMHQQAARDGTAALGALPDLAAPYFGHLRVRTAAGVRDVLLGAHSFPGLGERLSIVDWRRAPITEVFFTGQPGDDYAIDAGPRTFEGEVLDKRLLTFEQGELTSISAPGGRLVRRGTGWWFRPTALGAPLSGAPGAPLARQLAGDEGGPSHLGVAAELLDPTQRALLDRDPRQPLLILGSAGCGKTTVALHRVARLCTSEPKSFPPWRTLVVVPELGLGRLSERLLEELGLAEVPVRTFDAWVAAQARRQLSWLPKRLAPDTPLAVSKLKRHPALRVAMDRLVDDRARQIAAELDRQLGTGQRLREAMAGRREAVLAERLRRFERAVVPTLPKRKRERAHQALQAERRDLHRIRLDFVRLVGDRELLELAVAASDGALSSHHLEATLAHTNRQLDDPAEVRYAHVDPERLRTVDGRDVDDGTPDELAHTVDAEDHAIALELLYRMTGKSTWGRRGAKRAAHLVIDEAQELAPIELAVLGRHVRARTGAVTVAGDAAQQVDTTSFFRSWDEALEALGVSRAATGQLETTYRCPRPVAELAHRVLGPLAPAAMPKAPRRGPPVSHSVVPHEGHAALLISETLRELGAVEPHASVAIIAREARGAEALHEALSKGLDVRLVQDGEFTFAPGIEITEVAAVKGLEFDYVIVPDANDHTYPDTLEARRMLHVAVSRAAHQVWLVSPGTPSSLLARPVAYESRAH